MPHFNARAPGGGLSDLGPAARSMPSGPTDHDTPYATGFRVLVCVDRENMKPKPWSRDFRQQLHSYRADL